MIRPLRYWLETLPLIWVVPPMIRSEAITTGGHPPGDLAETFAPRLFRASTSADRSLVHSINSLQTILAACKGKDCGQKPNGRSAVFHLDGRSHVREIAAGPLDHNSILGPIFGYVNAQLLESPQHDQRVVTFQRTQ